MAFKGAFQSNGGLDGRLLLNEGALPVVNEGSTY